MKKEGWYTRDGIKVTHYVTTMDGKLAHMSLCGARQTPGCPWIIAGPRRCKRCEAIILKGYAVPEQENKKDGWYARKGPLNKVSHYVLALSDGSLHFGAICGANDGQEGWGSTAGTRQCKRCLDALAKRDVPLDLKEKPPTEDTAKTEEPKAFAMQVDLRQVVSESVVPITYIPVPDVQVIIDLLKRRADSDACKVSCAVTNAVIKELQVYMNEAEERLDKSETTTTWSCACKKE